MMRSRCLVACLLAVALCTPWPAPAVADELLPTAEDLSGLALRSIGPALMSGRVVDIAVDPTDRSVWYVAAASGGVWKTINNGTTWTPIFDHYGAFSIGCVTLDPKNPNVVWVGTGENNSQRSAGYGDGVYKSLDGGASFTRMGLETSEHIGKIVIDPRDSDVVYVAAQGPLWSSGGDRGLYKTTDGGTSWTRVLHVSEDTGVSDLVFDPRDPDVLYASSFQRRRRQWALVAGGPESAIYKSTDAGATWRELTQGLPSGPMGRIGLAISPIDPDVLYATIPALPEEGGFYRSDTRGERWRKMSDYVPIDPQYYQELFPDPHRFDRVYSMDVFVHVTEDGGTTFERMEARNKHVDNHALVFDPNDPEYLMVGCDGGLYESWDRGATWRYVANLPITQFYRVGIDDDTPFYNVYGGTQDNNTQGAPSRTTNVHGIRNSDWFNTVGGDGYQTRVDPDDPNILYSLWQYGGLVRYDRRNGQILDIQPQPEPDDQPFVWNWDSPLLISPHSGKRLYFAGNRLFRSDDRGDSWRAVSGDQTRGLDRNQLPVMGRVWSADAVWKNVFTSFYGSIVALDESPLVEGLLYTGTDDGLLHVSENGGTSWRSESTFPGVPDRTYVSDVTASQHDANVVYALFNNHKSGDFTPYVLKSADRGRTWVSLAESLPDRHVAWSLVEDHDRPDLLFLGTEFGLFTSLDGGGRWIQLTGGVPLVAFRDLEIQARENDLVAGTFGRGIYILDDYTPLRHLDAEALAAEGVLLPVKDAHMYIEDQPLGWDEKAEQGDAFFTAPNPPFGAVFTYRLGEGYDTRRAQRLDAEAATRAEGGDVFYPAWPELAREDREVPPRIVLTVRDPQGHVVARLDGPTNAGLHRVAWNLRHTNTGPTDPDEDARTGGPLALPGTYSAQLSKVIDGVETVLGETQTFDAQPLGIASLPATDRPALVAFQRQTTQLQGATLAAWRVVRETRDRLPHLTQAIDALADGTRAAELRASLYDIDQRLHDIEDAFRGDRTVNRRAEPILPGILSRVNRVVEAHWFSTSAPTQTHRRTYAVAEQAFAAALADLRTLVDQDLATIQDALDQAGAPWTPGRGLPSWPPR